MHQLDQLRRRVEMNELSALMAAAMGAEAQQLDTFDDAQARFDAMLAEPLPRLSAEDAFAADLRTALGLRQQG